MLDTTEYDVFISHADPEKPAAATVCKALEQKGIRCWIAPRNIPPGADWTATLAEAITHSRVLVLLLSEAANESNFVHREVERAISQRKPVLPVRLEDVPYAKELELLLSSIQRFDAFPRPLSKYLSELVNEVRLLIAEQNRRAAGGSDHPDSSTHLTQADTVSQPPLVGETKALRVALLYKRRAQPDEQLLGLLESHLKAAGHSVFIDRHMTVGVEWAKQIDHEIRNADAVVVLLSPASVQSEMLAYEVEVAHQAAQENAGKPRLLPVRINFEDPLPQELAGKLELLHYFL